MFSSEHRLLQEAACNHSQKCISSQYPTELLGLCEWPVWAIDPFTILLTVKVCHIQLLYLRFVCRHSWNFQFRSQVVDLKKSFGFADNAFDVSLCLGTLTYMEPAARLQVILCFRLRRFFFVPNKSLDLAWLLTAEQNLRLMTPLQSFVEWQELVAMWFSAWGRLGVSLTRPHILGVKGKLKKHLKNSEKNSAWAWGRKQRIIHKAHMDT